LINHIRRKLKNLNLLDPNKPLQILKTSYYNQVFDHGEIIIKLTKRHEKLGNEFKILKKINKEIPTPTPLYFGKILDSSILISKKIPGETAEKIWPNLTFNEQYKILRDLTLVLKKLHKYDISIQTYSDFIESEIKHFLPIAKTNPHHPKSQIESLEKQYHGRKQILQKSSNKLIHHDLWYNNIIVNNKNLSGLIDYEISLNGPIYLEFYKILHHHFTAKAYFDQGVIPYDRIDFLNQLIYTLQINYPELINSTSTESFLLYNIHFGIRTLGRFTEKWYNPIFMENYIKILCNPEPATTYLNTFKTHRP